MNAAEIIVREVQGDSGLEMRQLFAERIGEPGKPSHLHSHGQILPFHKRCADLVRVGIALADSGYNPRDAWWGVPRFGSVELSVVAKHLGELREVYIRPEALRHGHRVVVQSIRGQLHAIGKALVQVPQERPRIGPHALTDAKRGNQFGFGINGNIDPLVAKFGRVSGADVPPFLADVAPDFIDLQIPGVESAHSRVHETDAAFSGDEQKPHDRVAVKAAEPLCGSDRATLQKAVNGSLCRVRIREERIAGKSGVGFAERGITGSAAPALNAAFAEESEPFAVLVVTSGAGHVVSPLALCEETSQNSLGSEAWFAPRFGLAPTSAETEAGAHYVRVYPLGWSNRNFHGWTVGSEAYCDYDLHCVPPFSCRAASLQRLRGSYLTPKSFLVNPCVRPSAQAVALFFLVRKVAKVLYRFAKIRRRIEAGNPLECGLAVSRGSRRGDLPLLGKAFQNGVDGRQQVAVFASIEPVSLQPQPHCLSGQGLVARAHDLSDGIGQAECIFDLHHLLAAELGQYGYNLPQVSYLRFEFLCLGLGLAQFFHCVAQVLFGLSEARFVVILCHGTRRI